MERTHWAWMPLVALSVLYCCPQPTQAQSTIPPSPTEQTSTVSREKVFGPLKPSRAVIGGTDQTTTAEDLPKSVSLAVYAPAQDESPVADTSSLAGGMILRSGPLAEGDAQYPINLATALKLSDARPLIVAAAQASVWVAEAQLARAKVLWLPTLNIGFDYTRHDGGGPDFNGGVLKSQSVNFFYGGAGLTGATSITDAIYAPLVARQVLNSKNQDIQTAKNDALLKTAEAYFRVHQARGTYWGNLYTIDRGKDLIDRIEHLSRDLVTQVEVERAKNMVADIEQRAADSRQQWRVQSANLTQVLRLDPRVIVIPTEHDHTQITLLDPSRTLDDLMPIAMTNRPELASSQSMVNAAAMTVRQEKARPLIPNVRLNGFQSPSELLQGGVFMLGQGSNMNQVSGRFDFSVQPIWQLEACGIGNLARIKASRGVESQTRIDLMKAQDAVVAEVVRAHARLESATVRVYQADRALRTGIITFNGNFAGIQQTIRTGNVLVLVNRPQEAVYALQLLDTAFKQYFATVTDYNIAQFELFHAMGYPANEVSGMTPPGDEMPVDTTRPTFLPAVENGPPPATR